MPQPAQEHRKVEQILRGARDAFVELGYEGATVDEIARRAKVSKPTLYAHLGDKRVIFAAVLRREFAAQAHSIFTDTPTGATLAEALQTIGEQYIAFLLTADAQDLFRIVVAESQRFPDLGRAFYESGPGLGAERLEAFLKARVDSGELVIEDVRLAAHQFIELCRADLFYRRMLLAAKPTRDDVVHVAQAAVSVFLAAYTASSVRAAGLG